MLITPIASPFAINGTHKRECVFVRISFTIKRGSAEPRFVIIGFRSKNTMPATPSPALILEH